MLRTKLLFSANREMTRYRNHPRVPSSASGQQRNRAKALYADRPLYRASRGFKVVD